MKVWKRNLLIAYLVCSIVVIVFFYGFSFSSMLPGVLKVLLFLPGLGLIAGTFVGVGYVVYAFTHEHATLHAGPDGTINIELSALESTARRALESVEGVTIQQVSAKVIERKENPVIDLNVTAIPYGTDSLMVSARNIQAVTMQAIESFTDHEVRYVAVNFVEPRRRREVRAAREAVGTRAAADHASRCRDACADAAPEVEDERHGDEPTLWGRVCGIVSGLRDGMASRRAARDEDVVEAVAYVEDVQDDAVDPTEAPVSHGGSGDAVEGLQDGEVPVCDDGEADSCEDGGAPGVPDAAQRL